MPGGPSLNDRASVRLRWRYRRLTAARRSLPQFVIIGTQKAATTSMMGYLREHPDVMVEPGIGEVHFFDHNWDRGEAWYRSFFPTVSSMEKHAARTGRVAATGEKSPYYLMHPLVPARAAQTIPDARLIAILRDPVTRAASHHAMNVARGVDELDLAGAVEAEPGRIDEHLARILDGRDPGVRGALHHFSYVARGRYAEQLDRWLEHFPRQQLLVIQSEALDREPDATYATVLAHVGLAPHTPRFERHNVRRAPYRIEPAARALLEERFREPNRDLAQRYGVTWSA